MMVQDICPGNLLTATSREASGSERLTPGKVYIIDFDRSRRFADGPGTQEAVLLPPAQFAPPPGVTHLDPYSWDVYCVGGVLGTFLKVRSNLTALGRTLASSWPVLHVTEPTIIAG